MRPPKLLITAGAAAALASLTAAGAAPHAGQPAITPAQVQAVDPALHDDTALHEQLWSSPEVASLQSTTPEADVEALEAALDQLVDQGAIGVTARVEVGDGVWADSAGTRGLETNWPVLDNSPFRAASNTKMMIATLVMQEVDAGTWSLDTPIAEAVPGIFPNHPDVTLRQLLSHTSGIPNGTTELMLSEMDDPTNIDELVALLGDRYPDAQHIGVANAGEWTEPGEFVYSNAGYVALGVALEAVTDQSVGELLKERILEPLRMMQASYPQAPGMSGPAMQEAMWDGQQWHNLDHFDPTFFSHSGALVITAGGLAAFTEALITGKLFSAELVDEMMQPVSSAPMEYGLGMYRVPDPCEPGSYLYGHDGAAMGTMSVSYSSPDGERQLTFGVTGMDRSGSEEPLYNIGTLLQPMLAASCSPDLL